MAARCKYGHAQCQNQEGRRGGVVEFELIEIPVPTLTLYAPSSPNLRSRITSINISEGNIYLMYGFDVERWLRSGVALEPNAHIFLAISE